MRIGDIAALTPREENVVIGYTADGAPVSLKLVEPPLGLLESLQSQIPVPTPPPGDIKRGPDGRALKLPNGSRAREENRDDPVYLEKMAERTRLLGVLAILRCIAPGQVEFDSVKGDDSAVYAREILSELRAFGLGSAALKRLDDAAGRLLIGGEDQLDEADEALGGRDDEGNPSAA